MTDTPESTSERIAGGAGERRGGVNHALAWSGIAAAAVFIVAVVFFFSGFFIGRATDGFGGNRGGQCQGTPGMMGGPGMMGPGMMGPQARGHRGGTWGGLQALGGVPASGSRRQPRRLHPVRSAQEPIHAAVGAISDCLVKSAIVGHEAANALRRKQLAPSVRRQREFPRHVEHEEIIGYDRNEQASGAENAGHRWGGPLRPGVCLAQHYRHTCQPCPTRDGWRDRYGYARLHEHVHAASGASTHRRRDSRRVRTTTESDAADLVAELQAHVSSMYTHLDQGSEVTCMSSSLPTLFRRAADYQRQITLTASGVVVVETSSDPPELTSAIREHAREVTGFVVEGMPAMMSGMMDGGMMGPGMGHGMMGPGMGHGMMGPGR